MAMRVIVTGEDADGRTRLVKHVSADALGPGTTSFGATFTEVFSSDRPVTLPAMGGEVDRSAPFFPLAGGLRFWFLTIPAHCAPLAPSPETEAELDALAKIAPDYAAALRGDGSGMARADTIEWVVVLSGEIEHHLPGGDMFVLRGGDSVVQIGAMHRWANVTDAPCVMAVAAIGCARDRQASVVTG